MSAPALPNVREGPPTAGKPAQGRDAVATGAARLPPLRRGWVRASAVCVVLFAGSIFLSIAAAETFFIAAVLLLPAAGVAGRIRFFTRPRALMLPILLYSAATLASALASEDPRTSLIDTKELVLFLAVPLVYFHAADAGTRSRILQAVLVGGAISAVWGVAQYLVSPRGLEHRATGPLSHYMTFGGLMMLLCLFAAGRALIRPAASPWIGAAVAAIAFAAVLLSFSRNAYVGLAAGLVTLLALARPVWLKALPFLLLGLVLASPPSIRERMFSVTHVLSDPSNQDRVDMARSGLHMVRDHPWLGVGPSQVGQVYPAYRLPEALPRHNPHLHNNGIQIAAERGLIALAAWIAMFVWFFRAVAQRLRGSRGLDRFLCANGIASAVALLTAGLFEYNFGDSEIKMLFLMVLALPFATPASLGETDAARDMQWSHRP